MPLPPRINILGNTPEAKARRNNFYDKLFPQETINQDTTLTPDTHDTIWADSSSGELNLTLPNPEEVLHKEFTIKKVSNDGNDVVIIGNIDGQENFIIQDTYAAITVKSIGVAWMIVGSHRITDF